MFLSNTQVTVPFTVNGENAGTVDAIALAKAFVVKHKPVNPSIISGSTRNSLHLHDNTSNLDITITADPAYIDLLRVIDQESGFLWRLRQIQDISLPNSGIAVVVKETKGLDVYEEHRLSASSSFGNNVDRMFWAIAAYAAIDGNYFASTDPLPTAYHTDNYSDIHPSGDYMIIYYGDPSTGFITKKDYLTAGIDDITDVYIADQQQSVVSADSHVTIVKNIVIAPVTLTIPESASIDENNYVEQLQSISETMKESVQLQKRDGVMSAVSAVSNAVTGIAHLAR